MVALAARRALAVLLCALGTATIATAGTIDYRNNFEKEAGGYLSVDVEKDGSPLYLDLNGGRYISLDGDVVLDGRFKLSVYDNGSEPRKLPFDTKFAMYLRDDGTETNLYVVAAGNAIYNSESYTTTNFCLAVCGDALAAGWHRITVYVLRCVTTRLENYPNSGNPNMLMGFVVFIDEEPVCCKDPDYRQKSLVSPKAVFDKDLEFNETAKALMEGKYLFISPLRAFYQGGHPSQLASIGFLGNGCVDDIAVGYHPLGSAGFAKLDDISLLPTLEGVYIGMVVSASQTNGLTVAKLLAPEEAGLDDAGQAAYRSLFAKLVFEAADGGYMVMAVPSDAAETDIRNSVDVGVLRIDLGAVRAGKVLLEEVVPGIFYRVRRGSVMTDISKMGEWSVAQGNESVEVAIPAGDLEDTSGFFRIEASPAK